MSVWVVLLLILGCTIAGLAIVWIVMVAVGVAEEVGFSFENSAYEVSRKIAEKINERRDSRQDGEVHRQV